MVQTITIRYLTLLLLIKKPRVAWLVALLWVTQLVTINQLAKAGAMAI